MKKCNNIFFVSLILCLLCISNQYASAEMTNVESITSSISKALSADDINCLNTVNNNLVKCESINNTLEVFTYADKQINITLKDIDLMAKLVAGESIGEPYTGKVAVASVVLNRVTNPKFPNSIQDVIFQKNAFSCVQNNTIKGVPNEDCYRAVYEAISGADPTNKALFFYNPEIATCNWMKQTTKVNQLTIGHHTFFKIE